MKAETTATFLHLLFQITKGDSKYKEQSEKLIDLFVSQQTSLKVAEATLPNVKDWDEVYDKFKENYKNSEHILHPINFLSWLKQHYSTPLSATLPNVKELLTKFDDFVELMQENQSSYIPKEWQKRFEEKHTELLEIIKSTPLSASEQSPHTIVK